MNHTTKKAPAASGQGWKIAQKNAEIFNIHKACLWIIVTPRTQLSGHLVVAAAIRCQQLCWAKIPPPINRHTHRSCAPALQETASARSAGRSGGCTPQKFRFCTVYYRRIAPCLQAGCLPTRGLRGTGFLRWICYNKRRGYRGGCKHRLLQQTEGNTTGMFNKR